MRQTIVSLRKDVEVFGAEREEGLRRDLEQRDAEIEALRTELQQAAADSAKATAAATMMAVQEN